MAKKKRKKSIRKPVIRIAAAVLVVLALSVPSVYPKLYLLAHTSRHPEIPYQLPAQSINTPSSAPSPKSFATPPPTPKPAATPRAAATPATPAPSKPVAAAAPQPAVRPSPDSAVSGLAPVAPAPAPTPTPAGAPTSTPTPAPGIATGYTSTNWSGYIAAGSHFTTVSGVWNAPAATGVGAVTSADCTWIGIGGASTSDLVQVGTENIVSANGQVSTGVFYEMLPQAATMVPSMTVTPGDEIEASITEVSAGQWRIYIKDDTNGQTFTITVAYASSYSSAEWIQEDPSYSFRRLVPFDNFHTATFISGAVSDSLPVTMVDSHGNVIASPSALTGSGGFTVTRLGL